MSIRPVFVNEIINDELCYRFSPAGMEYFPPHFYESPETFENGSLKPGVKFL